MEHRTEKYKKQDRQTELIKGLTDKEPEASRYLKKVYLNFIEAIKEYKAKKTI